MQARDATTTPGCTKTFEGCRRQISQVRFSVSGSSTVVFKADFLDSLFVKHEGMGCRGIMCGMV